MRDRFHVFPRIATTFVATIAFAGGAHAARPLITDDARVVDPQACQLETWTKRGFQDGIREFWALPACNPTGNLEITAGGGRSDYEDVSTQNSLVIQGKTLFRPLEGDDWAVGLVAGGTRSNAATRGGPSLLYAYVPLTMARFDSRLILHFNAGANHNYETGKSAVIWGAGTEIAIWGERAYFIGEVYDDTLKRTEYQVGVRFWIVPNRVQIDTTYGGQFGVPNSGHFFTVGLRLLTPAFLPKW